MEFLMNRKLLSTLVLIVVTSCSGTVRFKELGPAEAPGWRSFRGNPQNTAYVPSSIQTPHELLWKYNAKKPLKSSPVLVGRILVVGSLDKRVHFLDAFSGKDLGRYRVSSSVSTSASGEGELVYFGPDEGKETLLALNLRSGKVLWKKSLGDLSSSPVLWEDKVFVGSGDGRLRALERESGDEIWEFQTSSSRISAPACASPTWLGSAEGILCLGSADGHLYALNMASGRMEWKFEAQGGIHSSPAVKNGMVFFGSVDGSLYALSLKDGSLAWRFQTQADIYSSPAAAESLVYIGSNDYFVYAVNQKTGKLSWRFETEGLVRSSPIAVGDKLFFGSFDGNLYVLNRFTGKLLWKYQTEGMISGSPAYFDGKIYIGSEDGFLYCFGSQ
jgi:outer membrane protein assembly factor BamB